MPIHQQVERTSADISEPAIPFVTLQEAGRNDCLACYLKGVPNQLRMSATVGAVRLL